MYIWTYRLRKSWLDKCLKSPVSKDLLTSNMLNGPKKCWNLNDSTFTIFIDPCESNSGWKSLSEWYANSSGCLVTQWLPITSIPSLIETIYTNIFRSNYLRNEKYFLNFIFHFRDLDSVLNIFEKKMTVLPDVFLNLRTPKNVVR